MNTITTRLRFTTGFLFIVTLLVTNSAIGKSSGRQFEFISTSGSPGQGGEFWQKKDYRQWSEADCRKMLEDSPWALKYEASENGAHTVVGSISPYNPQAVLQNVLYQVQFRSALPVRQAIVRLAQIKRKYDKMSPDQKKTFDQQTDNLLNANFQDRTILYFTYGSNTTGIDKDLATYWKGQTTDKLKNSVYLVNQRNEKIPLLDYGVNTGDAHEFEFDFPREQAGKPIILPEDKTVRLEFVHPSISPKPAIPVILEFKPSKMLVSGSLIY